MNEVRQWALQNGYDISRRGRIPRRVQHAHAAHTAASGTKQRVDRRAVLAAIPIAGVNATAMTGQWLYIHANLHNWILPGQILLSVTLETIAVFLAWHAHLSMMSNDSAFRLRMSAYFFAGIIAVMSYSHWAIHGRPDFPAVATALMSLVSPYLWGIHSRRVSRDILKERGMIDDHAVRLGVARWAWFPIRTTRVFRRAVWTGETSPARAIAAYSSPSVAQLSTAIPVPDLAPPGGELPPPAALTAVEQPGDDTVLIGPETGPYFRLGCGHNVRSDNRLRLGDVVFCQACGGERPYCNGKVLPELAWWR